jgi:hypothetical protein
MGHAAIKGVDHRLIAAWHYGQQSCGGCWASGRARASPGASVAQLLNLSIYTSLDSTCLIRLHIDPVFSEIVMHIKC